MDNKTIREEYEVTEVKDNAFDTLDYISVNMTVFDNEFIDALKLRLDNFDYWLNKIGGEGKNKESIKSGSNLDSLVIDKIWVSNILLDPIINIIMIKNS